MNRNTDNYMSPQIQNEYLKLMALNIGVYFSIMADECTDISNKEKFTICLRWVGKDLKDNEDFIGLYQVDSITALHRVKSYLWSTMTQLRLIT